MTNKKILPYVLSDLDGTLSDSLFEINRATVRDILAYQSASDHRFSFITGRLAAASKYLCQQLDITLPVVSCNGALISNWKTGEVYHAKYLDPQLTVELIKSCKHTKIQFVVYTEKQLVGLSSNPRIKKWKRSSQNFPRNLQAEILEYDNLSSLIEGVLSGLLRPVQLVLYAELPNDQKFARDLINRYANQIQGFPSLHHVFNITALGANKLTGLQKFAEILGIDYLDIVVFGDNYNDIPMIKGVKRGFVVANGIPAVQQIAYQVVPAMSENGVGKTLRALIEKNNDD